MSDVGQKQQYFNHYWRTRDLPSADDRSRQRAELVRTLLPGPGGQSLLEVGCGRGVVMAGLAESGYQVSGCDIASENISALHADGFDVFLCDLENDPLPGRYDIILCLEVLQQIFDPPAVMAKFKAALKPGGSLVVSVPNEFHIQSRLRLLLGRSHLGHFDESHIRLFTPDRAEQLFERVNLRMDAQIPVPALPPRFKFLLPLGKILTRLWPSFFALSNIYRLKEK